MLQLFFGISGAVLIERSIRSRDRVFKVFTVSSIFGRVLSRVSEFNGQNGRRPPGQNQ